MFEHLLPSLKRLIVASKACWHVHFGYRQFYMPEWIAMFTCQSLLHGVSDTEPSSQPTRGPSYFCSRTGLTSE